MAKLTVWLATSVKSKPLSVLWKEDLCNYHPGTELGFRSEKLFVVHCVRRCYPINLRWLVTLKIAA